MINLEIEPAFLRLLQGVQPEREAQREKDAKEKGEAFFSTYGKAMAKVVQVACEKKWSIEKTKEEIGQVEPELRSVASRVGKAVLFLRYAEKALSISPAKCEKGLYKTIQTLVSIMQGVSSDISKEDSKVAKNIAQIYVEAAKVFSFQDLSKMGSFLLSVLTGGEEIGSSGPLAQLAISLAEYAQTPKEKEKAKKEEIKHLEGFSTAMVSKRMVKKCKQMDDLNEKDLCALIKKEKNGFRRGFLKAYYISLKWKEIGAIDEEEVLVFKIVTKIQQSLWKKLFTAVETKDKEFLKSVKKFFNEQKKAIKKGEDFKSNAFYKEIIQKIMASVMPEVMEALLG